MGGLDEVKEQMARQMVHLRHPNIYTTLGVKPPTGILLFGAPGSGKTLMAKSSVGQLGIKMINISTPGKLLQFLDFLTNFDFLTKFEFLAKNRIFEQNLFIFDKMCFFLTNLFFLQNLFCF